MRRAEIGTAVLLTFAAIWLRWIAALSAGSLWRDEAAGVEVANLPGLGAMWNNMQYDSFPALWLLLARAVGNVAGSTDDTALRVLGFVIGVGVVGILWLYARAFGHRVPLVSLTLLGLAPSVIIWGDSARAYGLAMLTIILAGALIWRFVERPGIARFIAAVIGATAAVHVVFFNSVLLVAFCAGAIAVCVRKKAWRYAALVFTIGAIAAVSLVPYAGMLKGASTWRLLARVPEYNVGWFWVKLIDVLSPAGRWTIMLWLQLLAVALFSAVRTMRSKQAPRLSETQHDAVIFSAVSIVVGVGAQLLFMERLSYYPSPWYYLPLLALVAVCTDGLYGVLTRARAARIARVVVIAAVAGATIFPARSAVTMPMTNVDQVTARLKSIAHSTDLVLVDPWFLGVSFYRYYGGPAPWTTVPPIGVYPFHRYDLIKQKMMLADQTAPVEPVIRAAEETLRAGGKVFIAGRLGVLPIGEKPILLSGAPLQGNEWPEDQYRKEWSSMILYSLRQHATSIERVPLPRGSAVTPYEDVYLILATGWRP